MTRTQEALRTASLAALAAISAYRAFGQSDALYSTRVADMEQWERTIRKNAEDTMKPGTRLSVSVRE